MIQAMNCDGNWEMKRPTSELILSARNAMRSSSSLAVADNVNGRFPGGAYSDDGLD